MIIAPSIKMVAALIWVCVLTDFQDKKPARISLSRLVSPGKMTITCVRGLHKEGFRIQRTPTPDALPLCLLRKTQR
jgi:hypothetical protein